MQTSQDIKPLIQQVKLLIGEPDEKPQEIIDKNK
jgi:hypothetical protein